MAKRFTDTDKYKKAFMRGLPGPYKLFWDYLYHDCNHAGIWHVDFEVAQVYLGADMPIDPETALRLFNKTETRIVVLADSSKWFIKPFIAFQYKVAVTELNPSNQVHASVLKVLIKEGAHQPQTSPSLGARSGSKDKDSSKDVKDVKTLKTLGSQGFDFDPIWFRYPRKLGRKDAERHFKATVKTPQDYLDLQNALDCFIREIRKEGRPDDKIPYGSTWFNGWRDWVSYGGVQMPKPPAPKPRAPDPPMPDLTETDLQDMHDQKIKTLGPCREPGCRYCKKDESDVNGTTTEKLRPDADRTGTAPAGSSRPA